MLKVSIRGNHNWFIGKISNNTYLSNAQQVRILCSVASVFEENALMNNAHEFASVHFAQDFFS